MSLPLGEAWSISDAATEESAPLTVDEEGKPFLISYEVSVVSFLVSTPGIDKMLKVGFNQLLPFLFFIIQYVKGHNGVTVRRRLLVRSAPEEMNYYLFSLLRSGTKATLSLIYAAYHEML